ncbi:hypothetical protein HPB47_025349 [Ixodes persulcatus]|uniref:Uncharacterized protein n=1 Tax=Ixodes persulcatus TaxID=34615 RepID=A0AC60Q2G6_IXOPE|nr:hypothetical protein HPB47_025349 [Ixodes persulcatus]
MDLQPTEAPPASPAVLSLSLSAPPIAGAATPAITSLLDEPLVAAFNQPAIVTHNPFSILGNDDALGEFPPLNSTSAPPPIERSDVWHPVSCRRKTALSAAPPAASLRSEFSLAVILRPTKPCRMHHGRGLSCHRLRNCCADRPPVSYTIAAPYQVRYLDRSNQFAVDAATSGVRDALLKETHIPIGTQQISVQAYEAVRRGQIRGFIKNAGGLDSAQVPRNLHFRKCAILQARPLGHCGSALITFDGTSLPFRVGLSSFTVRVRPFHRQTQVCDTCHLIGHRSAQCPNSTQARCSTCGAPKHDAVACPSAQPKCRNCGRAHHSTAHSCLKRQEIQLAMARRDRGRTQRLVLSRAPQAQSSIKVVARAEKLKFPRCIAAAAVHESTRQRREATVHAARCELSLGSVAPLGRNSIPSCLAETRSKSRRREFVCYKEAFAQRNRKKK